jgi:hypothetical protein
MPAAAGKQGPDVTVALLRLYCGFTAALLQLYCGQAGPRRSAGAHRPRMHALLALRSTKVQILAQQLQPHLQRASTALTLRWSAQATRRVSLLRTSLTSLRAAASRRSAAAWRRL